MNSSRSSDGHDDEMWPGIHGIVAGVIAAPTVLGFYVLLRNVGFGTPGALSQVPVHARAADLGVGYWIGWTVAIALVVGGALTVTVAHHGRRAAIPLLVTAAVPLVPVVWVVVYAWDLGGLAATPT